MLLKRERPPQTTGAGTTTVCCTVYAVKHAFVTPGSLQATEQLRDAEEKCQGELGCAASESDRRVRNIQDGTPDLL